MPLLFFGRKKEKEQEQPDERLVERTKEILTSYRKLVDSVLIDTVRITEGILDGTGLTDIDRTLWGMEFPKVDPESLALDKENLNAVLRTAKRFYHTLSTMDSELTPMNYQMRELIDRRGSNFAKYGNDEINIFRKAARSSAEIRKILMIPLLDEQGKLTEEAKKRGDEMVGG